MCASWKAGGQTAAARGHTLVQDCARGRAHSLGPDGELDSCSATVKTVRT